MVSLLLVVVWPSSSPSGDRKLIKERPAGRVVSQSDLASVTLQQSLQAPAHDLLDLNPGST